MDIIGNFIDWAMRGAFILAAILYIIKLVTGKIKIPDWIAKIISSNVIIGLLICAGLLLSLPSLYDYLGWGRLIPLEVTTAATEPDQSLTVIYNSKFENQTVPLDGHRYDHCTFINCSFIYRGGAYELTDVTLKKHWYVYTVDQPLTNYLNLLHALQMGPNKQLLKKIVFKNNY